MTIINSFTGEYRFLSNFWPVKIPYVGFVFPSVEHAYQAMKTIDENIRFEISKLESPGQAKRFGRKLKVRAEWDIMKPGIMKQLLKIKFSNPELKQRLLNTKPAILIEGNTWGDTYWGVCTCHGKGDNILGKLLMEIRDE